MEPSSPYDSIAQQPLARLRRSVAASFSKKQLPKDFVKIADDIEKHVQRTAPDASDIFREEKKKALSAAKGTYTPDDPDLSTPELQLLWGAALATQALMWQVPTESFTTSEIWQAISAQDVLEDERRFCAQITATIPGLRERQGTLKVEWGIPLSKYPDIGFYCDPQTNTVNLDMTWTLIIGIEHARSLMLREAANGLGTIFFTDAMQTIRNEMMAIKSLPERTEEQHTRMIHLAAQWLARFDVATQAESNFANRFTADRTEVSAQHYAASLNYTEAVAGGIPEASAAAAQPVPPSVRVPARFKMNNLLRALHYSFFKNNNLFPDTPEGWRSVGVRTEWIETSDGAKKGVEALAELSAMCLKMENLQPGATDRNSGDNRYAQQMADCSVERCKLVDMIFERFASHMMPELELDAEKNPQETMDRMEKITGDGNPQEADGKDGDSAKIKDKGKERDSRVPPENPRKAKGLKDEGEPSEGEGEPGEGEGEPGEDEGEPGEGEGEPGDGEGEPGEGDGEPGDGEGEPGEGDSDKDGKLDNDDFEDQLKKLKESLKGGGGKGPGDSASDEKPKFEDQGSYNEYLRIIGPHRDLIRQAAAIMKKIQEKLTIEIQDPSERNSLVPEDGDVSRFQPQAMQDRLVKQFSGQAIDETDFETFRLDGPIRTISPPTEIQIWIDGSGSMQGERVEMAITTGCILYEAAREAGMDVYISMMGEPEPLIIAKPGQSDKEIGKNIESVREGQGGNKDFLSPVIGDMVQNTLAKKRGLSEPVGNTHAFAITDGGFTDGQTALDYVTKIHKASPHTTIDFVMIGGGGTQIERLVDAANKRDRKETLGHKSVNGARDIHDGVMELLNKRLRNVRKEDAIPLAQKQKEFKSAKLSKKKLNGYGI